MNKEIVISFIIPSYKSENSIKICLEAIFSQNTDLCYEVIVVDSSPTDEVDNICKKFTGIKFIKKKKKTFPGVARNIGAADAKGELLVFIDADIIIPKDWTKKVFDYYKNGHAVFSCPISIYNRDKVSFSDRLAWFVECSEYKTKMKEEKRWCLPGGLLAIKKEIFNSNKFLNLPFSEDVEFTVRLRKGGSSLYFYPGVQCFHKSDNNFLDLILKFFRFGSSNMIIRHMHNVSGSCVVKNTLLYFFAVPVFALTKFIKISYRNMAYNSWIDKLLYILFLPYVVLLVIAWMFGAFRDFLKQD